MPEHESGLEAVARSDRLLDTLAAGARMPPADPVASMLAEWRDDVRRTPDTHVISLAEAADALAEGKQARPGQRFGLTVVGGVAAALLCVGGFGAVVHSAGPGDALYGLRTALFGSAPTTREDQVALAAQTELAQVQQLVQQGQWQQAQDKLAAVSTTVQDVTDAQRKQDLINQWNDLTVKVVARDPGATLTPGAPPPILPGMSSPLVPGSSVVPGSPSLWSSPTSPPTSPPSPASPPTTSGSETAGTTGTPETVAPFATTTPSPVAAPPPPPPTPPSPTTVPGDAPTATTTAASPPPATLTPTTTTTNVATTTTTVTLAPRGEESTTSVAAPNGPSPATSPQQPGPAVVNQQQTSDGPPTSTAADSHGWDHGSPPGPPGYGAEVPQTTPERGGN